MNISSNKDQTNFVLQISNNKSENIDIFSSNTHISSTESEIIIQFHVNAENLNLAKNAKLKNLALKANIPGFRPGKVPTQVLWNKNQDSITGEIIQSIVDNFINQYTKDHNLDLYKQPKVEIKKFDFLSGLDAEVQFSIMPSLDIPDFSSITLDRKTFKVEEKDIDDQIDKIMLNQKRFVEATEKTYKIKNLDQVNIDYVGEIDGEKFEGGSAKNHNLNIGSKSFIDNFEEQLIGHKIGDNVEVKVKFPDDYHAAKFAGKSAIFHVTINKIMKAESLSSAEELAKFIGGEEYTVAKLREQITKKLSQECNAFNSSQMKIQLFDILDEQIKFSPPQEMIEEELESVKREFQSYKEELENHKELDLEKLAFRRVKLGVLLSKFADLNKITVEQDDLIQAVRNQAMANPSAAQAIIKYYTENRQALNRLRGPILEDKAVSLILSQVSYKDLSSTVSEILNISTEN